DPVRNSGQKRDAAKQGTLTSQTRVKMVTSVTRYILQASLGFRVDRIRWPSTAPPMGAASPPYPMLVPSSQATHASTGNTASPEGGNIASASGFTAVRFCASFAGPPAAIRTLIASTIEPTVITPICTMLLRTTPTYPARYT